MTATAVPANHVSEDGMRLVEPFEGGFAAFRRTKDDTTTFVRAGFVNGGGKARLFLLGQDVEWDEWPS